MEKIDAIIDQLEPISEWLEEKTGWIVQIDAITHNYISYSIKFQRKKVYLQVNLEEGKLYWQTNQKSFTLSSIDNVYDIFLELYNYWNINVKAGKIKNSKINYNYI